MRRRACRDPGRAAGGEPEPRSEGHRAAAAVEADGAIRDTEEDQAFPEPASSDSHPVAESPAVVVETAENG